MYLPFVNSSTAKTKRQVVQFGGLNRTQNFKEGELADCLGLSSREWPCLSQRQGRKRTSWTSSGYTDLYAWDQLVTVSGKWLYYGVQQVGEVTPGKKQFAVVNTKLCIFPDKKYLDLETLTIQDLGAKVDTVRSSVVFGADYLELRAPHSILGHYTMDRSGTLEFLNRFHFKVYAQEDLSWDAKTGWGEMPYVEKTAWELRPGDCLMLPLSPDRKDRLPDYQADGYGGYATDFDAWGDYMYITDNTFSNGGYSYFTLTMERRSADGTNQSFADCPLAVGDTVTLSGCVTLEENNLDLRIAAIEDARLTFDSPVLTTGEEKGAVSIERRIPDLDFICESGNRLVGVSNADKTIYISALGDPRNFYDYRGLSVSSSFIPVGTSGDFTGCIAYGGNVLLFKEECLHRLMGNRDGNYALYTDQVAGVQKGSERSMVILNEVLYYKGREGVYAYTGSTPKLISGALGDVSYRAAAAGTDGRRYYISMERADTETWELLAYDTRTGLWLKEEDIKANAFARKGGDLYMLTGAVIYALDRGEDDEGQAIDWSATFAPFDETTHRRKYPSRLLVRLELGEGAWVEAELSRDGGPFQNVWTSHGHATTAVIPIRPGRCDRYQLRLKGKGRCLLRSLEREFSLGGVG